VLVWFGEKEALGPLFLCVNFFWSAMENSWGTPSNLHNVLLQGLHWTSAGDHRCGTPSIDAIRKIKKKIYR